MKVSNPQFQIQINELLALGRKIIADTHQITVMSVKDTPQMHTPEFPQVLSDDEILEFALACIGFLAMNQPMVLPGVLAKIFTMLAAPEDEEIDMKTFMQYRLDIETGNAPRIVKVPFTVIPGETFDRSIERLVAANPGMPPLVSSQRDRLWDMYNYAQNEYAKNSVTLHSMLEKWLVSDTPLPLVGESYEDYMQRTELDNNVLSDMARTDGDFSMQHRMMMEGIRDGIEAGVFSEEELTPPPVAVAPESVVVALKAAFKSHGHMTDVDDIVRAVRGIDSQAAKWIDDCSPREFYMLLSRAFPPRLH